MYIGNHHVNANAGTIYCKCPMCGKEHTETVDENTFWNFEDYRKGLGAVQDIFPDKPANFREWLITGYCYKCQELLFGEPDDDEFDDEI